MTMTKATSLAPAPAPTLGCRAELDRLSDDELLVRFRALPRDSHERSAACELLVARYERLVRSCVRQYRGSPEPVEDLMQVGYVGLLKAINNFDPAFGSGLSAYAAPCISGEVKRHFRDKRWQVHVRRSAQELLLELRKATEELTHTLGRQPNDDELVERLGCSGADLLEARQADLVFTAYSLDAPLSDRDDPAQLSDVLGDEDAEVEHAIDMEAVSTHWDELPEREQRIIVMRFYGNLTQAEIGARLGISQMHVSRLLSRALGHLRSRLLDIAVVSRGDDPPYPPMCARADLIAKTAILSGPPARTKAPAWLLFPELLSLGDLRDQGPTRTARIVTSSLSSPEENEVTSSWTARTISLAERPATAASASASRSSKNDRSALLASVTPSV
jgi:RNA polymerase sigma-B factor